MGKLPHIYLWGKVGDILKYLKKLSQTERSAGLKAIVDAYPDFKPLADDFVATHGCTMPAKDEEVVESVPGQ